MKNTCGEGLSVFYPIDHESKCAYVIKIKDVIYRDFFSKNHKGGLQLDMENAVGSFFDWPKLQIDIYTFTWLVTPSKNVILFWPDQAHDVDNSDVQWHQLQGLVRCPQQFTAVQ